MTTTKRRKVSYKLAEFMKDFGSASTTLESLLKKAVKKVPTAVARMYAPQGDPEDKERHFINYQGTHSDTEKEASVYACEFLAFETGADQSTIILQKGKSEVSLDSIQAGDGKEFVGGSVYFSVVGNHVVMMGSRGCGSKQLEDYLNWLLIKQAAVVPEGNLLLLKDHVANAKKKKLALKGVKGMTLSSRPSWGVETSSSKENELETSSHRVSLKGHAWDAVKAFFGSALNLPSELSVENLADVPSIEVSLHLKWQGRHKEDDDAFLDGIASNLRHVDDEVDYKVFTGSGEVTRDDFKTFIHISSHWERGRPRFNDLFPKMADWLAKLARDGKLDT